MRKQYKASSELSRELYCFCKGVLHFAGKSDMRLWYLVIDETGIHTRYCGLKRKIQIQVYYIIGRNRKNAGLSESKR